jgi:hypothetical protein
MDRMGFPEQGRHIRKTGTYRSKDILNTVPLLRPQLLESPNAALYNLLLVVDLLCLTRPLCESTASFLVFFFWTFGLFSHPRVFGVALDKLREGKHGWYYN